LYTFLHEGGHAIIAILYGGKIDNFILGLNAHVQHSGANFTHFGEALLYVNGVVLPVIFIIIALFFYKHSIDNIWYHFGYYVATISVAFSCLPWAIIPIISLFTSPPESDDVTRFMNIVGSYPLIMVLIVILIMILLTFLAYKRGLISKLKVIFSEKIKKQSVSKKTILIRVIVGMCVVVIVAIPYSRLQKSNPVLKSYYAMEVSSTTETLVLPFEVSTNGQYDMDLELQASGFLTDIRICDENGILVYQNISETFSLESILNFDKGDYEMSFIFLTSPDTMIKHFNTMGYDFNKNTIEQLSALYDKVSKTSSYPIEFSASIH
jgi:hypothetical protein